MNRYPWLTRCFYSFILSYFSGYQLAAQTDPSLIWAKGFGNEYPGGGANQVLDIIIDGSGNRYITGSFNGAADFDLGDGVANLTGAGGINIFLAKYDASGNYLWAKSMGGAGIAGNKGASLCLDGSGNVYVTGNFSGTFDFDPGAGTANLTSAGDNDIFLAKYDASGNYLWAKSMGGTSKDEGNSLVLDGSGNVLLTGFFNGTFDFDPGDGTANLTSAGGYDIFLAKYDASGNYVWAKRMGGTVQDVGTSIAVDGSGNVLLTGGFSNTADFDPDAGSTANLISAGATDIFLAKYDASGNYVWAKRMGGTNISGEQGRSLVLDGSGNVLLTGYFLGTVDFDPGDNTANLTSPGGNEIFLAKYDASGNYVWAKRMGGTGADQGNSLALDGSGNVLLTGTFNVTADFDPGDGIVNLTPAGGTDIFLAKYDASGNYVWAKRMGGTAVDQGFSLALDASGNLLLTGIFNGTVDFDPGDGTANRTTGSNTNNGFVAAYTSATGEYVNAGVLSAGSPTNVVSQSVTRDGSGNVYVTGNFSGRVDFDPGAGTANLTSAGGTDIFLAKYDASGNYLWSIGIVGTGNGDDVGNALALDGSGNVLLTGYFTSTADFDPGAGTANLISAGGNDIFLAKYDAVGNYVWAKRMGGTAADQGTSLVLDGSGNVLLTGFFNGTADFDPGAGSTANLISAGGNDIFLAKYDASGNYVWAKRMGGTAADQGTSLVLDGSGNVLLTGNFSGTADFDPGDNTANLTSAGDTDIFLAKYDASGNYLWSIGMGGTLADQGTSLVPDGSGNVVLTGSFNSTADFDPGAGTANLISAGDTDIFLAKYNASGNYVWAKSMGGTAADQGTSLVLDGSGNVLLTGFFNGTADFDPGAGTVNLTSAGGNDIFLAQYDASGNYVWATSIGGTGFDQGNSLVLDGSGNVVLTGFFNGTADFGPGAGTANLTSMSGGQNGFIAVYSAPCINPTSGGTIAAPQTGASGFDPAAFTSNAAASGHSGTLEYKWQSSTTSSSAGFSDIASSNAATYNAGALTQTTWYKRLARVTCKADWTGAAESNVLEVTVHSSFTWNGSTSTDWNTAANWTPNFVPSTGATITIPSGLTYYPVTPSTLSLTSLTMPAVNYEIGASIVTLTGSLSNNGSITGTGKVVMGGSSAQTISGTGTISNLEVNNSAGVTITSGMQTVTGMLTPTSGTLTTGGFLTLKSDASGTARVASLGATASISGNLVAERYVPQNNNSGGTGRAWRLVSVPVTGSGTLRDFFMNGQPGRDLTVSTNRDAEAANSGTPIVGHGYATASAATGAAGQGFDWVGVVNQVSSLRRYVGNATGGTFLSENVPDMTTDYSNVDQGYMVFTRGDRKVTFPSPVNASATTFRSTGALKTGDRTVSVVPSATSRYTLVGNPYMSVLDLSLLHAHNSAVIKPSFWIWDANIVGTHKQGAYVNVFHNGSSWVTNTGTYTNPERIESGMAFFVEPVDALATATNITIKESHKSTAVSAGMVPYRSGSTDGHGLLYARLELPTTGSRREIVDGVLIDFHKDFKESMGDLSDRVQMRNTIGQGSMWLSREGRCLSSEGLPWPGANKRSIPLYMSAVGVQPRVLSLDPRGLADTYVKVWLKDKYIHTETQVDITSGLDYTFTGTGDAATDSARFELVFVEAGRPTTGGMAFEPGDGISPVRLWPNPAKSADVKLSLGSLAPGRYEVQVLDMSGRLVLTKSVEHKIIGAAHNILGKEKLASGLYTLILIDQNKQPKETLRLVVD